MIQSFERNINGRDFAVGDIHGYFNLLEIEMARVGFNTATDRIFAVGDLINRGPFSNQATHYLAQPWFHSVMGNHEALLIETCLGQCSDPEYCRIGGSWYVGLPRAEKEAIARVLRELPLGIQIETAKGTVGIVHAEVPRDDWNYFLRETAAIVTHADYLRVASMTLWGRERIKTLRLSPVFGIRNVFVGHTPQDHIVELGNVTYLDGGTYRHDGKLNLIPITQFGI